MWPTARVHKHPPWVWLQAFFFSRRTYLSMRNERLCEYEKPKYCKSTWAATPPLPHSNIRLFFMFCDPYLWVRFSVKKKRKPCCLQSQAIPVDGHWGVFGWFFLLFWTISYAIVCHPGYHEDQKHAKWLLVVTGLESGGNKQLFTVCFSLNECASALIFK